MFFSKKKEYVNSNQHIICFFLPNFVHHTFRHLYSTAVAVLNEGAPGIQFGSHPRKILFFEKKNVFSSESSYIPPLKIFYEIQI